MSSSSVRVGRAAGALAALAVAAAGVAFQHWRFRDEIRDYGRLALPAFDPHVYVAMAENPAFFTVAPWGYRVLTPALVHVLRPPTVVRGFQLVTAGGFVLAGVLLYGFLRCLGHGAAPALLAVAAFELSRPVAECVQSVFVMEPLSVVLEIAFLLATALGLGLPTLALLLALIAGSKEIWLLLAPVAWLSRPWGGRGRAVLAAAALLVPPIMVVLALRFCWVPHVRPPHAGLSGDQVHLAITWLVRTWPETWPGLVLDGVTPLAFLGLLHPAARLYARRYGPVALALTVLALVAWVYTPSAYVMPYYGANTTRLMLYALPLLLPLALWALDLPWRRTQPRADAPRPEWKRTDALAAWVLAAVLVSPFLFLDRYRRLPLHARRDGPLVLTTLHESLRTARRLESGRRVEWDLAASAGDAPPRSDLRDSGRMRWFLREGWGEDPAYSSGPVTARDADVSLLLPCLRPADIDVTLTIHDAESLSAAINGRALGAWPTDRPLRLPGRLLLRGDNLLTLSGRPGWRLSAIAYEPAAAPR